MISAEEESKILQHNLKIPLFAAFGVELEYAIVERESLNVMPIADKLLAALAGDQAAQVSQVAQVSEVLLGEIELSNELALHVIELKCGKPAPSLLDLPVHFQQTITKINVTLAQFNACLLPTGAHPWMNPAKEFKLWPHDNSPIYQAYHRIFNCQGHGWSNLQSVHLNLPFANDEEFAKLHAAIRLLLPIIPALSASSPLLEGKNTGFLDSRLEIYRNNQKIIPSIAGQIIPECVMSCADYQQKILQPMYRDISSHDHSGILQHEWLNSRGAIARFLRNTIEIRIIDTQECPVIDIAILYFIVQVLQRLVAETWLDFQQQCSLPTDTLAAIFNTVIKSGKNSVIDDQQYLTVFGYQGNKCTVGELWQHILAEILGLTLSSTSAEKVETAPYDFNSAQVVNVIQAILTHGSLSERILRALNGDFRQHCLREIYGELSSCLLQGKMFVGR